MTQVSALDLSALHAQERPDVEALIAALHAAAALPLRRRWTWLGIALDRSTDPDPRVRAAAVGALSGATGLPAIERLCGALDDGEAPVRAAAVTSLTTAACRDASLWMPALYHPRPDVRDAAIDAALAAGRHTPWHLLAPLAAADDEAVSSRIRIALASATLDDRALHRCVSLAGAGVLEPSLVAERILASPMWDDPAALVAATASRHGIAAGAHRPFSDNVGRLLEAVIDGSGSPRDPKTVTPIARRIWRLVREVRLNQWAANHVSTALTATGLVSFEVDALRAFVSTASLNALPALRGRRALDAVEPLHAGVIVAASILARLLGSALCTGPGGALDLRRAAHLLSRGSPSAIVESTLRVVEKHPRFDAACAADPEHFGAWIVYAQRHVTSPIADRLTVVAAQQPELAGPAIAGALTRTTRAGRADAHALISSAGAPAIGDLLVALARMVDFAPRERAPHTFVPSRGRVELAIAEVFAWLGEAMAPLAVQGVRRALEVLISEDGATDGVGILLARIAIHPGTELVAATDPVLDHQSDDQRMALDGAARRAMRHPVVQARHPERDWTRRRPIRTSRRVAAVARRISQAIIAPVQPRRTPLDREAARRRLALRAATALLDHPSRLVAREAAEAVLALEPHGADRLAARIVAHVPPAGVAGIVRTWPLWPTGDPARQRVLDALAAGELAPAMVFRVALVLAESGHPGYVDIAEDLATRPWHDGRATRDEADRLWRALGADRAVETLARSPHPAMRRCVARAIETDDTPNGHALADVVLRHDTMDRAVDTRLVERLDDAGHPEAWRLLGGGPLTPRDGPWPESDPRRLDITRCQLIAGDGALAGPSRRLERNAVTLATCMPRAVRAEALLMAAEFGRDPRTQERAMAAARPWLTTSRTERAVRLAALFAWGEAQAMRLLGRRLEIQLIAGSALGYTRLEGDTVYINPLPLLSHQRHGEDIARGLVVHEIGHHVYNGGAEGRDCWRRAVQRGLGSLMNLVCDEHLERNLRATDATYGDHFKRLGAWAFQRADRQMADHELLDAVGPWAAAALPASALAPGREIGTVRIEVGRFVDALARAGSKLSLFLRTLRLGLGDRFGDDTVREALLLFDKGFRHLDNPGLLAVTELLADHFRDELPLMNVLDVHGIADGTAGDRIVAGRGVGDDDVREAREGTPPSRDREPTGSATFNRGAKATFDIIDRIERLPFDPDAWRALSADVASPARRLQRVFETLGHTVTRERRRPTGHRIDRTGAPGQLVRSDPRVLQRRAVRRDADLFVGLVVDCSGSMGGDRMVRARRFAALVASAARRVGGVDLRVFGFTDRVIYDAGDDRRPAIAGLKAGGGNNDAAGLAHAAWVARRSTRPHRLLIMISDGLPTECTTSALRELVQRLTRHGMLCAQVAVAPLREQCFEHYIEVLDADFDASTRAFGRVVERLASTVIRGR